MNELSGKLIIGLLTGVDSSPWTDRNNQTRHNHYLIISNPYQDNYGNPQTDVTRIRYDEKRLPELQKFANENAGQRVAIPILPDAANGRNGAFVRYFLPNSEKPLQLSDV